MGQEGSLWGRGDSWWGLVGLARILATALLIPVPCMLGLTFPLPPTGASRTLDLKGRGPHELWSFACGYRAWLWGASPEAT